jgi:hypothetical protein
MLGLSESLPVAYCWNRVFNSSISIVPDLSASSKLKRLLQSVWFIKILHCYSPFLSSLASILPLPSLSTISKNLSSVIFCDNMMFFNFCMSCFYHIGLFLCLPYKIVLNSYKDIAFLPWANPVILCIDITSWGNIPSP